MFKRASHLIADRGGAVAIIFAFAIVPLVAGTGAAVDYSRATSAKAVLQKAVDAAALNVARDKRLSYSDQKALATFTVEQQLKGRPDLTGIKIVIPDNQEVRGRFSISVTAQVPMIFASFVGQRTAEIGADAQSIAAMDAEVALVLDNTGSMKDDMVTLRDTAKEFVNILFDSSRDDLLRMSVVPYVAAVNPGRRNLQPHHLDANVTISWHGRWFRNVNVASFPECDPKADQPAPTPNPTPTPTPTPPPPVAQPPQPKPKDQIPQERAGVIGPLLHELAGIMTELFGSKNAHADVTPNTRDPLFGSDYSPGAPWVTNGQTVLLPDGFTVVSKCTLRNPTKVSHLDLFNRVPGATWKGCVEARPDPYDVTDDPPNSGNSLFTPYFWPDEPGTRDSATWSNSYVDDTKPNVPRGWTNVNAHRNIFKYDGSTPPTIDETAPTTKGPNASCPDELLRLTNDRASVIGKIDSLNHWFGGGTMSSEGFTWGWRTISPNAPFGDGKPYGETRKFIVIMSDGENNFSGNVSKSGSDYSAYGYISYQRTGSNRYDESGVWLDQRLALACNNAKQKGITVLTILFRESSTRAVDNLKSCASNPSLAYRAADRETLRVAFREIAMQISSLRIAR